MNPEDAESTVKQEINLIRRGLKTPRAAAVAGILFSLLYITILVLFMLSVPVNPLEAVKWSSNRLQFVELALHLIPFAGIAFLWFIGVIRDRIGEKEDRFFSTVFLGSGLLFVAMLFCFSSAAGSIMMIYRHEPDKMIESGIYLFGRTMSYQIMHIYGNKMAGVFMILTSKLSLHTGIVPRWMGLLGFLLGTSLIFCIGLFHWLPLIFPVWVLLISIYIFIKNFA